MHQNYSNILKSHFPTAEIDTSFQNFLEPLPQFPIRLPVLPDIKCCHNRGKFMNIPKQKCRQGGPSPNQSASEEN
ncbi:hypothetical protein JTE90_004861 [Oedothorax gibbosus]|uniref:Uncharacterized protein n=1 Tax=Oedothorax gibbosus TaxID=931172 RepID=A0AAV6UUB6_9ARAC|nr:hypothetical protein JTE90_004861 [Oedothorax gibbosus]